MDEAALQTYLIPSETLLWSGAPGRKFRLEQKHYPLFFLLPFFCLFLIIPIIGIFQSGASGKKTGQEQVATGTADQASTEAQPAKPPPLPARIFFAVFFIIMMTGFFAFMARCAGFDVSTIWRGDTLYAITNQRLVVITGKKSKTARSVHLASLSDLRLTEWPDGLGKISFGPEPIWPYGMSIRDTNAALDNIAEPRKVFQIIAQARKSA